MTAAFICDGIRIACPLSRRARRGPPRRPRRHPHRALMERHPRSLAPRSVADVIFGCANQAGEDNQNIARMGALLAGLP